MKTFYKIVVFVISVSASATSFAGDNDWQHEKPSGGSYSNSNNRNSSSSEETKEPTKSLADQIRESAPVTTVTEAYREHFGPAGSSDADKAGDTSGQ